MSRSAEESPAPASEANEEVPARADGMGATVTGYMLAGPLVYGGLGYVASLWLHIRLLTLVGLLVGMALSLYVVWLRYGEHERST